MDSKIVFPKVYRSFNYYGVEASVWVNPTQIVRVDYPVKEQFTLSEMTFVWSASGFATPAVAPKLVKLRLARIENIANTDICQPGDKAIFVNAAAVWALQTCNNGTLLYLAQTSATLEPSNAVLVVKTPEPAQSRLPDSSPKAIAGALGIELAERIDER